MRRLRSFIRRVGACWKFLCGVRQRPHLSTLVLLLPVVAVLVLANWPGWRVTYLNPFGLVGFEPSVESHYEHGWPLTYLRRQTYAWDDLMGPVRLSAWKPRDGIVDFTALSLVLDLAASIAIVAFAGILIEAHRRRQQSCFQFRLSELLIFVTVVAIVLSWYAVRRNEYREECRIYQWLHREDAAAEWPPNDKDWYLEGPEWLRPIIGDQYFVFFARLRAVDACGFQLKEVAKLRHLLLLRLEDQSAVDLSPLSQMSQLKAITFTPYFHVRTFQVDEDIVSVELPALPQLRAAGVEMPPPGGLSPNLQWRIGGLSRLKSLESLRLQDEALDDRAMAQLDGLRCLRMLDLRDTRTWLSPLLHRPLPVVVSLATDDGFVGGRVDLHGLLDEPVEQFAPRC